MQRPRQISHKFNTLGLATEKYIQIAVVLVSAKCTPGHGECAKMCFASSVCECPEVIKCPNFSASHFVFIRHDMCIEAIEMLCANTCTNVRTCAENHWILSYSNWHNFGIF